MFGNSLKQATAQMGQSMDSSQPPQQNQSGGDLNSAISQIMAHLDDLEKRVQALEQAFSQDTAQEGGNNNG